MEQAFFFMAGVNSTFAGDKLLTTPNPAYSDDRQLFDLLGLEPMPSSKEEQVVLKTAEN